MFKTCLACVWTCLKHNLNNIGDFFSGGIQNRTFDTGRCFPKNVKMITNDSHKTFFFTSKKVIPLLPPLHTLSIFSCVVIFLEIFFEKFGQNKFLKNDFKKTFLHNGICFFKKPTSLIKNSIFFHCKGEANVFARKCENKGDMLPKFCKFQQKN